MHKGDKLFLIFVSVLNLLFFCLCLYLMQEYSSTYNSEVVNLLVKEYRDALDQQNGRMKDLESIVLDKKFVKVWGEHLKQVHLQQEKLKAKEKKNAKRKKKK